MKSKSTRLTVNRTAAEVLEARIAPATIRIGFPTPGSGEDGLTSTEYIEDPLQGVRPPGFDQINFIDTSSATDILSVSVDSLLTTNTFYLRLQTGDKVVSYGEGNGFQDKDPLIEVKKGNVIAFFTDINRNNIYDSGELTGLSLGKDVDLEIRGFINGDIVTNLDERGTSDFSDDVLDLDGMVSHKQGIKRLVIGAGVDGGVYSGGNIKEFRVSSGNVQEVLLGTAVNAFAGDVNGNGAHGAATYDFFQLGNQPGDFADRYTLSHTVPVGQKGASITNASFKSISGRVEAGGGGVGAAGGFISNVTITEDSDGFSLIAGPGGRGDISLKKPNAGAGGAVTNVLVLGTKDLTPNSALPIFIRGGDGGDAVTTGKGGAGGLVKTINIGYTKDAGGVLRISQEIAQDAVRIEAGNGGGGKTGGLGGSLSAIKVRVQTPDLNGDEIAVIGGRGGSSLSPVGKAGAGGNVSSLELRNLITTPDSDILVLAGSGGLTFGQAKGANGGNVSGISTLGFDQQIIAGRGSDGKTGGNGGFIKNINIEDNLSILTRNLIIGSGLGGNASAGNGGKGGVVDRVTVGLGDFKNLVINPIGAADGGNSLGGKGGVGGSVTNLLIVDNDSNNFIEGSAKFRAGDGGDGEKGGGAGGGMTSVQLNAALQLDVQALSGLGGDALIKGKGGAGGLISRVNMISDGLVAGSGVGGTVIAGRGGNGVGSGGAGGVGGSVSLVNISVDGDGYIEAGDGGSGQSTTSIVKGGAPGNGGSISVVGVFAKDGSGVMLAGDAGTNGSKAAIGGSIIGGKTATTLVVLRSTTDLIARAGSGSHGGAGGDIKNFSYGSTADSLTPTPSGTIEVIAGHGSSDGSKAGKGGSIIQVDGTISSGAGKSSTISAGNGGGDILLATTELVAGDLVTAEVVDIDLTSLSGIFGGKLAISFGGDRTPALDPTISTSDLQSVINALPSIQAAGGVSVAQSVNGYSVTFNQFGQREAITTIGVLGKKAGAGGSVSNVTLSRGGAAGSFVVIEAGHAGDSLLSSKGMPGGAVTNVAAGQFDDARVLLRSIAAGDGGDGLKTGGAGGSIKTVISDYDIGARTGQSFGYQTMGGIFAGVGGSGLKTGIAGSVDTISAPAISAIVAGRGNIPALAEKVDNIVVKDASKVLEEKNRIEDSNKVLQLPFKNSGAFKLAFGAEETTLLPANATARQVQDALNGLVGIRKAGGVSVVTNTNQNYQITFGSQATTSVTTNPTEFQLADALNALPVIVANGGAFVAPIVGGGLRVTVGAQSADIPVNPSATQMEAALDSLTGVSANGGFVVALNSSGGASAFNISLTTFGNQLQVTGVEELAVDVAEVIKGRVINLASVAQTEGSQVLPIQTIISGSTLAPAVEIRPGVQFFALREERTGTNTVTEIQSLDLSPLQTEDPGSRFTLTYEGETTIELDRNAQEAQIQDALNGLLSIQAVGGVTVRLAQGNGSSYLIEFNDAAAIGDLPSILGSFLFFEKQVVDFSGILTEVGSKVLFSFDNDPTDSIPASTTPALDATSSASDIQLAINSLPAIALAGTAVTVNGIDGSGNYQIVFNTLGDQQAISFERLIRETQTFNLNPISAITGSEFHLTINKQTTERLPVNATAQQIDAALESLSSIGVGGVNVTKNPNRTITVSFNSVGNQEQITPIGLVHEKQKISLQDFRAQSTSELNLTLDVELPVLETVPGSKIDLLVRQTVPGEFSITTLEATPGSATTAEIQFLEMDGFTGSNASQMILTFGVDQTAPIISPFSGPQIEAALNQLNSIRDIGGVTLAAIDNDYSITFPAGVNHPPITVEAQRQELQQIDTAGVPVGGQFVLEYLGQRTGPLPKTATEVDIQSALATIGAFGGNNPQVRQVAGSPGQFEIKYEEFGDSPLLVLFAGDANNFERQVIDISEIQKINAQFQLSFQGQESLVLPSDVDAALLQDRLNLIPAIQFINADGSGNVSVTDLGSGKFEVLFNALTDQSPLTTLAQVERVVPINTIENGSNINLAVQETTPGAVAVAEVQTISISQLSAVAGGAFQLSYAGASTSQLPTTSSIADISGALNALPPIQAAGGVAVSITPGQDLEVRFNNNGDRTPIAASGGGVDQREQQILDLRYIRQMFPNATFNLSFEGDNTVSLPVSADASQIQTALNNLVTVSSRVFGNAGAVTVIDNSTTSGKYDIDFNFFGNVESILSTGNALQITEQTAGSSVALAVNESQSGSISLLVTESLQGTVNTPETQNLDISTIQGVAGANFTLSHGGLVTALITAPFNVANIQNALTTAGINATVSDGAVLNTFDILFAANGDQPAISATANVNETQTISTATLSGLVGGQFTISFEGDVTALLSFGASPAVVQAQLNALPTIAAAGGVTVVAGAPNEYAVKFNAVGQRASFQVLAGGITSHEKQILDVTSLTGLSSSTFQLSFNGQVTDSLPGNASASAIQSALNALTSIQSLQSDGTGSVSVNTTAAGVHLITFNIFGNQNPVIGSQVLNLGATAPRISYDASVEEIEAALAVISLGELSVTEDPSTGELLLEYLNNGNQSLIRADYYIHEHQKIDVFSEGAFKLQAGLTLTAVIPQAPTNPGPGATPAERIAYLAALQAHAQIVEDQLNLLPDIINSGGVDVVGNEDSSVGVFYRGDNDKISLVGIQFEPMQSSTIRQGATGLQEVQLLNYYSQDAFKQEIYEKANLVGAIADFNESDATKFHYFDRNGDGKFNPGDTPIDGLIMARVVNTVNFNFTPEAYIDLSGFYDYLNRN